MRGVVVRKCGAVRAERRARGLVSKDMIFVFLLWVGGGYFLKLVGVIGVPSVLWSTGRIENASSYVKSQAT